MNVVSLNNYISSYQPLSLIATRGLVLCPHTLTLRIDKVIVTFTIPVGVYRNHQLGKISFDFSIVLNQYTSLQHKFFYAT